MTTSQESDIETPVVEARNLRKRYGHVTALDGANITIRPREVVALVGDNGAGKSTLAKVLSGALSADEGSVSYCGQEIHAGHHPVAAQEYGIEVVYQDLALAPDLNIAQNLFLGKELTVNGPTRLFGGLARKAMWRQARDTLNNLGLHDFPHLSVPVRSLSGGQQQAIAVVRAVMWAKSMVVMDEPTAALGVRQTEMVYRTINETVARGLSVLVISHDIPKMLTVADRIAVMRHGVVVAMLDSGTTSLTEVVGLMLGSSEGAA